jgi:S1-C subfamily serine protease
MPSTAAPAKGAIEVPASAVARAIERKDVRATNAVGTDGKPIGVRIHGVNRYRAGLRDGDVILSVAGTPTETTTMLVEVSMKVLAAGATKLTGKIARESETWDVVLELPPR